MIFAMKFSYIKKEYSFYMDFLDNRKRDTFHLVLLGHDDPDDKWAMFHANISHEARLKSPYQNFRNMNPVWI